MTAGRLGGAAICALALAAAGCGSAGGTHAPTLASLPLVPGAKIVSEVHRCDPGANAFCAIEVVVVAPGYASSDDLVMSEHQRLRALGWNGTGPDTTAQHADESPGHKLRLTYATAYGDLQSIDLGAIVRPWPITYALSNAIFDRQPAMSMLLEVGNS